VSPTAELSVEEGVEESASFPSVEDVHATAVEVIKAVVRILRHRDKTDLSFTLFTPLHVAAATVASSRQGGCLARQLPFGQSKFDAIS
jgi:hypothetical protein